MLYSTDSPEDQFQHTQFHQRFLDSIRFVVSSHWIVNLKDALMQPTIKMVKILNLNLKTGFMAAVVTSLLHKLLQVSSISQKHASKLTGHSKPALRSDRVGLYSHITLCSWNRFWIQHGIFLSIAFLLSFHVGMEEGKGCGRILGWQNYPRSSWWSKVCNQEGIRINELI